MNKGKKIIKTNKHPPKQNKTLLGAIGCGYRGGGDHNIRALFVGTLKVQILVMT
jgi:hypothetical protein